MKILFILVLAMVVFFLGMGFFAMAEVKEIPKPNARVISVEGGAKIKPAGQSSWENLTNNREVFSGDAIKTGDNGLVGINFFDNSSSRIGPNSEVALSELMIDDYNFAKNKVSISVTIGRVWSRILKLADKDASFEVNSSSVVATVRGTAFDFQVDSSGLAEINTTENVVDVAVVKTIEKIDEQTGLVQTTKEVISKISLQEGFLTVVDPKKETDAEKITIINTPEEVKKSDWFESNMRKDEEFKEAIKNKQAEINKRLAGVLPDSEIYILKKTVEQIKLAETFNEEKKLDLETAFVNRRLAEAQELEREGRAEASFRTMDEYQGKVKDLLKNDKLGEKNKNKINNQRNLKNILDENREMEIIKESEMDIEINRMLEREADMKPAETSSEIINDKILQNDTGVIKTEGGVFVQPIKPPTIEGISEEIGPIIPRIQEGVEPVEKIYLVGIGVFADKYNMLASASKQFHAVAFYSNGLKREVTPVVAWSLAGDIGSITPGGILKTDIDGGKGIVSAGYSENGIFVSASSPEVTALTLGF